MAPAARKKGGRRGDTLPVFCNRAFWKAKQALLGGKTGSFAMPIPLFRHALIMKELHEVYSCEKHLHFS